MNIDHDKGCNIVGIEVLKTSKRVENPRTLEYAVAGKTPQCVIEGQSDSLKLWRPNMNIAKGYFENRVIRLMCIFLLP